MAGTVKSQTERTALLLGVGYSARALIAPLKSAGYTIVGTCRTADKARSLSDKLDITMLCFDGKINHALKQTIENARVVISSIPPNDLGDPFLKSLNTKTPFPNADWVGYLSATSVYGDRKGQWVFEDELLYPTTQRGKNRVEAELEWLETGAPVHIFRLAGIYGPDIHDQSRNPFSRIKSGKARAVIKPGHVVNRIHVEDIASDVIASIESPDPTTIYNLADGHPAPPQNVLNYAAELIAHPSPPKITMDDPSLSDMAKSFYSESKRVANERARNALGWSPRYRDYKSGLKAVLSQGIE